MSSASPAPSVVRNAFRGTLIYSVPLIAQRGIGIVLLSIVTRVLTPDDYGMMVLLEQVAMVLSTLLGGHFATALGYFYFQSESREHHARVTGTAIGGAFVIGSLAAILSFPASHIIASRVFHSSSALRFLPFVFLSFPFNFLVEALFGWLRVTDRQRAFAAGSLLRVLLTSTGIGVLVGIFKFHVIAYMVTTVATLVITSAVFVVYLFRATPLAWSFPLFWQMLRFSLPLSLSWIAMFVINFGDQFVLRQYRSLGEVGIYGLSYRISMLVNFAATSFFSYWNAQVYQILRRPDARTVFARFFTYFTLLITSFALLLILPSRPGLRILVAPAFRSAVAIIPLLVCANAIRALGEFVRTRFLAAGRPRNETYCTWGGMAVCIIFYALLIPRYGMWGAAWASFLTFVVMVSASFVWTYRIEHYAVEFARLWKLATVAGVILLLYFTVPVASFYLQVAWAALLLAAYPLGLIALGFPTPGELQTVRSFLARFKVLAGPPKIWRANRDTLDRCARGQR